MPEPELSRSQEARLVREIILDQGIIEGAKYIIGKISLDRYKEVDLTEEAANEYVLQFVQYLLDKNQYYSAASLLWGKDMFNIEPISVRMIWEAIPKHAELLVQGAGSLGKSFTIGGWLVLDWLRDPAMTCVKVMSSTQKHAKQNVFAHMKNLHANAIIKLPGERQEHTIQVNEDDKQGIHLMTIPMGDEGKGRLRGFHPVPRGTIHPQFGTLSRVRAILDEAEEIPGGVWEDVDNLLITKDGVEHVKMIAATNPKDRNSRFGVRSEPGEGWSTVDIENSKSWTSRMGGYVLRLDGADCENVKQRKIVFPGLLSWEGYQRYLSMGDQSPQYYTMARGWYPVQGIQVNVVPAEYLERARGVFTFYGKTTYCAAVDLAFEGGDKAVMTIGKWGRVMGWLPKHGTYVKTEKLRHGLQLEQIFELPKLDTDKQTDSIIKICKSLNISASWLIVDRTGNGTGVHDMLRARFGREVSGVHFGENSTEQPIMEDESENASELYDKVVTEVWFAMRKWFEFDYLKFGPMVREQPLFQELTARKFKSGEGKKVKVESKKEYKKRGFASCDDADSLSLLVHLVRTQADISAVMMVKGENERAQTPKVGHVDKLEFMDMND